MRRFLRSLVAPSAPTPDAPLQPWLRAQAWKWRGLGWALPTLGIVLAARYLGLLQHTELAALDQLFILRNTVDGVLSGSGVPIEKPGVNQQIVIVEVDEDSLEAVNSSLIPDGALAQVLRQIQTQNPRLIGLDLYRDLPVPPTGTTSQIVASQGTIDLHQAMEEMPNLWGVTKVVRSVDSGIVKPPSILEENQRVGSNDFPLDADGKIRRIPLFLDQTADGEPIFSFSFLLACRYLNPSTGEDCTMDQAADSLAQANGTEKACLPIQPGLVRIACKPLPNLRRWDGGYVPEWKQNELGIGYQLLLNYWSSTLIPVGSPPGHQRGFLTISFRAVLDRQVPNDLFRDRIVLIGPTAESLKDLFQTPYSSTIASAPERMPGVVIHANAIVQLLAATEGRSLIKTWPEPLEILWISGWSLAIAILTWQQRATLQRDSSSAAKPPFPIQGNALVGIALISSCTLAFLWGGWWLPLVPTLASMLLSALAVNRYLARSATEIRQIFGRYLTDDVVANLLENPEGLRIGGKRRKITILSSDLRGFTAFSERLDSEEVVRILNIYLGKMTDVIETYGGTIDSFMGDGILVIFGAPTSSANDAERAVACAIAMHQALDELNQRLKPEFDITLEMGIGINTGEAVVGNIGSEKHTKYSMIGSHVNLACRIESFTVGGQLLISQHTLEEVEPLVTVTSREHVQAKGVQKPVAVYDVQAIRYTDDLGHTQTLTITPALETMLPLPEAIALKYALLDDKQVDPKMYPALLIQLSEREAQIQIDLDPEISHPRKRTNLKLHLQLSPRQVSHLLPPSHQTSQSGAATLAKEDIYAKVLDVGGLAGGLGGDLAGGLGRDLAGDSDESGGVIRVHIRFTNRPPAIQQVLDQLYRQAQAQNQPQAQNPPHLSLSQGS